MDVKLSPYLRIGVLSFFVVFGLFYFTPISLSGIAFLILLDALTFLALLFYPRSSEKFGKMLAVLICSSFSAFVLEHLAEGHRLRAPCNAEIFLLLLGILELLFLYLFTDFRQSTAEETELFPEQKEDLRRIQQYISRLPQLGVNAKWGNGKSFLWAHLREDKEIQKEFEVIQIDLLTCNLDSLELILIQELEKILIQYRIYPENSRYLKRLLRKTDWLGWFDGIAADQNDGFSATYDSLQEELRLLPKKVLLCFEDIDRISDPDTIKKVFALSEKLASERVHVLFQYNIDLLSQAGLSQEYLEKYVPHTVGLTPIPYEKLVGYLWDTVGLPTNNEAVKFVSAIARYTPDSFNLSKLIHVDITFLDMEPLCSIRKVRAYLLELRSYLHINEESSLNETDKTNIRILFIKHFLPECYHDFKLGESALHTLRFVVGEQQYTMEGLINYLQGGGFDDLPASRRKDIAQEAFIEIPKNHQIAFALSLLDYFPAHPLINQSSLSADSLRFQDWDEHNDKIDHLIWKVLANGSNEMTSAELISEHFIDEVLSKPESAQLDSWDTFCSSLFQGTGFWENETISFHLIDGMMSSIFRVMKLSNKLKVYQTASLNLLFACMDTKKVSIPEFLHCLCFCNLLKHKDFFASIHYFNAIDFTKNPIQLSSYPTFYSNYFSAVAKLQYINEDFSHYIIDNLQDTHRTRGEYTAISQQLIHQLDHLIDKLSSRKKDFSEFPEVQKEYDALILFAQKHQAALSYKKFLSEYSPSPRTHKSHSSTYPHQKEMDLLREQREELSPEEYRRKLWESYDNERLYFNEFQELAQEMQTVSV